MTIREFIYVPAMKANARRRTFYDGCIIPDNTLNESIYLFHKGIHEKGKNWSFKSEM